MYKQDKDEAKEFLEKHFLSFKIFEEIKKIRYQLLQCLVTMGFVILDIPVDAKSEHDDIYRITLAVRRL